MFKFFDLEGALKEYREFMVSKKAPNEYAKSVLDFDIFAKSNASFNGNFKLEIHKTINFKT